MEDKEKNKIFLLIIPSSVLNCKKYIPEGYCPKSIVFLPFVHFGNLAKILPEISVRKVSEILFLAEGERSPINFLLGRITLKLQDSIEREIGCHRKHRMIHIWL